jgi:putative endopeptidase
MDVAAVERAGLTALRPLLDRALKLKDKDWLPLLAALHQRGIPVVWRAEVRPDLKDATTSVLYLDADGLGLPDRDYYLKPELAAKLDAYRGHVARLLALAGVAKAEAAAGDVLAIERELARLTPTAVARRARPAGATPRDLAELARRSKKLDWKAYWQALGVDPGPRVMVGTPAYVAALDGLRARFTAAQWGRYFAYHLVIDSAGALPAAFVDEAFALERALTGVTAAPARAARCIDSTDAALGGLLGPRFVAARAPAPARQAATAVVDALVGALRDELGHVDWLSAPARAAALAKLAKLTRLVGAPDAWPHDDVAIARDDFAGNRLRARAAATLRNLRQAGHPVDRRAWQLGVDAIDADYDVGTNAMTIPAGLLQPPYFAADRAVAVNLGGLGVVVGHELIHAFDDQGAQFDGDGNLASWWSKDDAAAFAARGTCVADQYDTFEAARGRFVSGRLTLGEDLADLGGVRIAFLAYRALRQGAAKTYVADGFSEDQQFFLAVGQAWCSVDRPDELERRLTVDVHAPPRFRVYGALRNLPAFADAFRCAAGTPMRPAKPCAVW